jgi:hypothetical protein
MSAQPRRKYPRRAPLPAEEVHTHRPIEKLRDINDTEFAPKTAFIEISDKQSPYVIMEDVSDRSASARRRKNAKDSTGQFGLQSSNFEGKKASIKNWRPLATLTQTNSHAAVDVYSESWMHLKDATDLVFQGEKLKQPFETLYNKVEQICVSKSEAMVFRDLQTLFRLHIGQVNLKLIPNEIDMTMTKKR